MRRLPQLQRLKQLFGQFPVVAILGPRQVGKTTLAQQYSDDVPGEVHRFDLERPADLRALRDPMLALEDRGGLVILDEVQRLPEVFPVLRVLADRPRKPARFLVLGSASPDLLQQSSEFLGLGATRVLEGFTARPGSLRAAHVELQLAWRSDGGPAHVGTRTLPIALDDEHLRWELVTEYAPGTIVAAPEPLRGKLVRRPGIDRLLAHLRSTVRPRAVVALRTASPTTARPPEPDLSLRRHRGPSTSLPHHRRPRSLRNAAGITIYPATTTCASCPTTRPRTARRSTS